MKDPQKNGWVVFLENQTTMETLTISELKKKIIDLTEEKLADATFYTVKKNEVIELVDEKFNVDELKNKIIHVCPTNVKPKDCKDIVLSPKNFPNQP